MNEDYLILDIETAPDPRVRDVRPPRAVVESGIRDDFKPETVGRKMAENHEKWLSKAALDWRTGRIAAVGLSYRVPSGTRIYEISIARDGYPGGLSEGLWPSPVAITEFQSEAGVISRAWDIISAHPGPIVGFNVRDFDLWFLLGRSGVNGITPTRRVSLAKYRTDEVVDWMEVLANWNPDRERGWTLDYYAEFFGLPHRPVGDSALVPAWVEAGEWDKVLAHLLADLHTIDDLHRVFAPAFLSYYARHGAGE